MELVFIATHIGFRDGGSVDCQNLGNRCPRVSLTAKADASVASVSLRCDMTGLFEVSIIALVVGDQTSGLHRLLPAE